MRDGVDDDQAAVFESVLSAVRVRCSFFFEVRAGAPWATATPSMTNIGHIVMPHAARVVPFHIMLEGAAWAWPRSRPDAARRAMAGDVILFASGEDHIVASAPDASIPPEPDVGVYAEAAAKRGVTPAEIGGNGARALMICGYIGFDREVRNPLIDALADVSVVAFPPERVGEAAALVQRAILEQAEGEVGASAISSRLSELVLIDALRRSAATMADGAAGWIGALSDTQLARALRALHERPTHPWTIDALAKVAGMSRSVFAERFRACVGEPPIAYATRWRLQLGAQLLVERTASVAAAAAAAGYASEAAFARAFLRATGETPSAYRAAELKRRR